MTTVDVKLLYEADTDRLIPVIIDVNAVPAAIAEVHHPLSPEDVIEPVARAFVANLDTDNGTVAAVLSSDAYDEDTDTWVTGNRIGRDRARMSQAIKAQPSVSKLYRTASTANVTVDDGTLVFQPASRQVDGYVNFQEFGSQLLDVFQEDIGALSQGAVAPSAVWVNEAPLTGKWGLHHCGHALLNTLDTPDVTIPSFTRVKSLEDLREFREQQQGPIVVKTPYGSWGYGVHVLTQDEDLARQLTAFAQTLPGDNPSDSFVDAATGEFIVETPRETVDYLVAEGAIIPTDSSTDVLGIPPSQHPASVWSPIDCTVLACVENPAAEQGISTPSRLVRLSGHPNWNLHRGPMDDTIISTAAAFRDSIDVRHSVTGKFSVDFPSALSSVTERQVSLQEVDTALQRAGEVAIGIRNLSAFLVERELANDHGENGTGCE